MKIVSTKILGLSMSAGALVAAAGLGVHAPLVDIQAAPSTPIHASPPPPPPPTTPSTAVSYVPGNPNPNPGAEGGGGGGGGG